MKLGDILKKERERKKLSIEYVTSRIEMPVTIYLDMEAGVSPAEVWGPRLALIAIELQTPTSRLIAETGKSAQAKLAEGQCGKLIRLRREGKGYSQKRLAELLNVSISEIDCIEEGITELETYAPALLSFAEIIEQPIFNLFYPCGLSLSKLIDYP